MSHVARSGPFASSPAFLEEPFDFTAEDGVRLAGTVSRPQSGEPVPAVLLISGSGPLDRNSNMPGQTLNIASALASHFAQHGIASLRYDKRGAGASSGDYLRTGFEEERQDAAHALEALDRVAGVDNRIGVIGHSVGATIAIGLASGRNRLAAAVLLSAAAGSGLEVMQHQSERIAATMGGVLWWRPRRFIRDQERHRRLLLESRNDVVTIAGQELPARWFREYMQYDPSDDLASIACPVLAITGRSDVQVDPGDVARIGRAVRGEFSGDTPEFLTHLLRKDVGPPGLHRYPAQMRKPVDTGLLNIISAWLVTRLMASRTVANPLR